MTDETVVATDGKSTEALDNLPTRCPRCESTQPHLHPALQFEGEVQLCLDPWHASTWRGREALRFAGTSR